jgi:L-ascorbate metabolism protein UlaG (beta-lactamase superfamily)
MKKLLMVNICLMFFTISTTARNFEKDIFKTSGGDLAITFIGHGTLMMEFDGKVIHIDPVGNYADYSKMPKADLILITHEHGDHLDLAAIEKVKKENTEVVLTQICAKKYPAGKIMKNGDSKTFADLKVEAVPAYNIKNVRSEGNPFHPKGNGNGYVIHFANKKVYVAGDTENIPEMANLKDIDVAFLPMNLPYTMTPEMVLEAVKLFHPKILYPYHFGNTDTKILTNLMKDVKGTEMRIRKLN